MFLEGERGKRNGRRQRKRAREIVCNCREEPNEFLLCCVVSVLVCKHVQSPSELLSAEQGQEGSGRRNTTYGGLMRFYSIWRASQRKVRQGQI